MEIPFFDLKRQNESLKLELTKAQGEVFDSGKFISGGFVENFENAFGDYLGLEHVVGSGNGTDAIEIALSALGVSLGDEVIVPSISWISTAYAVSNVGGTPVFVDIEPTTFNIDWRQIESRITQNTKALILVHLFGNPAQLNQILEICRYHNIYIIEDCAQAHGAEFVNRRVGGFGDIGTFSFYPTKNLGAFGDAGCLVTKDATLAQKIRSFSQYGISENGIPHQIGRNSRLDPLQANWLFAKLKYLDQFNNRRIEIASRYQNELKELVGFQTPLGKPVYYAFPVVSKMRNELKQFLDNHGIATKIPFSFTLPDLPAYQYSLQPYPVAKTLALKSLCLPIFPELMDHEIDYIIDHIKKFFD